MQVRINYTHLQDGSFEIRCRCTTFMSAETWSELCSRLVFIFILCSISKFFSLIREGKFTIDQSIYTGLHYNTCLSSEINLEKFNRFIGSLN